MACPKETSVLDHIFLPVSDLARSLESKTKMLLRAAVGSPPAVTQVILLRALRAFLKAI